MRLKYVTLLILVTLTVATYSQNSAVIAKIKKLTQNGSVVLNDENGKRLLSLNADKKLVPASIIKVLTSQIALDILGKEYRFKTAFFVNKSSDLLIRGNGDPFLVSNEIRAIAKQLKKAGITSIDQIFLDHSYFVSNLAIPGMAKSSDPYNALNGATVVNFNTINIKKTTAGNIISGESETPLTPLAIKKAGRLSAGRKERVNLSANVEDCHQYAGELFSVIFKEFGIEITKAGIGKSVANKSWKLVYTHTNSRTISEVIVGLLKYSNNYIANQIFLELGAKKIGTPASLKNGNRVYSKYISEVLGLSSDELNVVEGSGISRSNSVRGNIMVGIMEKFKPNAKLLALKKGHFVKSGTLTGVYNYVGYIKTAKGLRSFSIMLNQENNYRDSILKLLAEY